MYKEGAESLDLCIGKMAFVFSQVDWLWTKSSHDGDGIDKSSFDLGASRLGFGCCRIKKRKQRESMLIYYVEALATWTADPARHGRDLSDCEGQMRRHSEAPLARYDGILYLVV
jgi:hypothetical protein